MRNYVLVVLSLCLLPAFAAAAQAPPAAAVTRDQPLEPADTSSPRATLYTFFNQASEAWRIGDGRRLISSTERSRQAVRAIACLDLRQVPVARRDEAGLETAILLLDVFNRIPIPSPEEVPDAEEMVREGRTRWVVPHTSITIARVEEGDRSGEWLFTADSVAHAKDYYMATRHLPLNPGAAVEDGYRLGISLAGWMIIGLVARLPDWSRVIYFEQTVWQWGFMILILGLAALVGWGGLRWLRWLRQDSGDGRASPWRELARPGLLMLISSSALYLLDDQVNLTGAALEVARVSLDATYFLAAAWGAVLAGRLVADAIIAKPEIRAETVDAQLIRLGTRLASFAGVFVIALLWAETMGIPVSTVVAGLGIGGIAVALAAQQTIENFFGTLTIFADRPVRVGDFVGFNDEMGTVEQIGLRSTRIRTLARSVVTVPNAQFSRMQLNNLTLRDRILFRPKLSLSLETTTEQLERVLSRLRDLLLADERIYEDTARCRLIAVGPHAIEIEVYGYVKTNVWADFLAIQEELYLQIMSEVEQAGTALVPPAQTTYLRGLEQPAPLAGHVASAPTGPAGVESSEPAS